MTRLIDADALWKDITTRIEEYCDIADLIDIIERQPTIEPEQRWIPVKMRPMDSEEREYFEYQLGYELENKDAVMFDCEMPEDGQEILISFRKWINMDKCEIDGFGLGLEGNGDWEGVTAWMPLPEPWKGEEDGNVSL